MAVAGGVAGAGRSRMDPERTNPAGFAPGRPDLELSDTMNFWFSEFLLDAKPKSAIYRFGPVPVRGAFRDRHKRGVGCGGRGCAFDEWCGCVR